VGPYGVAVEAEPTRVTVVVLAPGGGGASGLPVTVNGAGTKACGHGCYRVDTTAAQLDVSLGDLGARFSVPRRAPAAEAAVKRIQRWYAARTSVAYVERLASDPEHALTAHWRLEAPNRVSYTIADGAQGIVIGNRRWDRAGAGAKWVESPQSPLQQPSTQWTFATNAHRVGPGVLTFADPTIPAFFTLRVRGATPRLLEMTAAAHFMHDRYLSFDSAPQIRPPR
jgi:hypothetical protein